MTEESARYLGQAGEDAICADTLDFVALDGSTRRGRIPDQLRLAAGLAFRNVDGVHAIGGRVAAAGAVCAADLGAEAGTRFGAAGGGRI